MDSAVILPVFGLASLGTFSMVMVSRAAAASTRMVWVLRVTAGSAQISTMVRSGPMPASARAAATFTLAGKPWAASKALPLNTSFAPVNPSREMSCSTRYGAPSRPAGGLRVSMVTLLTSPSAAARTASSPSNAPVGMMMRAPVSRARSIRCMRGSKAPQELGTKMQPASMAAVAASSKTEAGAASTMMSHSRGSLAMSRISGRSRNPFIAATARSRSRTATAASLRPGTPASNARARCRPMAPRPTMPTVSVSVVMGAD